MSPGTRLDEASVEAVARRVVELLLGEELPTGELVDAAEIARRFSISADYVYRNADQLGCIRLGTGSRPRLRFDPAIARSRIEQEKVRDAEAKEHRRKPRSVRRAASNDLLPIKGEVV